MIHPPRFAAARIATVALALALLAGCADTRSGYPSLAPRPVERSVMQVEPAPAAPAVAAAPVAPVSASADVAQIVARAQAADATFRAELEKARPKILAAKGATEGSETWVAGQQAYSDVDAVRGPVGDALVELDRRRLAASEAGNGAEEAAIIEAMQQLQALDEAEQAQLALLMPR